MAYKSLSLSDLKSDLRSPKSRGIQRGLPIRVIRVFTLIGLDVIALSIAWSLAINYGTPLASPWTQRSSFFLVSLIVVISIFLSSGLYKAGVYRRNYGQICKTVSLANIILLLLAFLYEPEQYLSRSSFLLFWIFSITAICLSRLLFDWGTRLLRENGVIRHSAFVITEANRKLDDIGLIEKENCYTIVGVDEPGCLDLGNREQTFAYLRQLGITEAFVSWDAIKNRLYVCWHFYTAGITLRVLPSEQQFRYPKSLNWSLGDMNCLTIPAPIIIGSDFWVKRCFDLCCSLILVFLLSPVYLTIALLIKLDSPGPVFFRQERVGLHCKKFKIWKFRTMVTNAEKLQADLEAKNEIKDGVLFKLKDDPRVTRLGKFLRRYSLDELPQIFNVMFGEMSLVGPRPLPIRDVERFQKMHFIRQEVLPGITGLWQVSGRSDIDNFEDAVKLDIAYIENWSLWMDIRILLRTVRVVLQKSGAY
ncbi:sugar transferase [Calothrix sp. NIES-3974]|uniref:sugar transferase n=1 Tax=Calothrix sp. NIES-3974 TaxID=2005462 RepID=UPI000B6032DE|nr:sugar transferase [Calothrix sp. NIES-3974]BAZ03881.1 sugar transferase [Calothrix sp. NIES-3974]